MQKKGASPKGIPTFKEYTNSKNNINKTKTGKHQQRRKNKGNLPLQSTSLDGKIINVSTNRKIREPVLKE